MPDPAQLIVRSPGLSTATGGGVQDLPAPSTAGKIGPQREHQRALR